METGQACDYSGWRGGIGIAFGSPSRWIPDVMELGYEIAWGVEDFPGEVSDLGVAIFRYWNSIVEVTLRDRDGAHDFSGMEDKARTATGTSARARARPTPRTCTSTPRTGAGPR